MELHRLQSCLRRSACGVGVRVSTQRQRGPTSHGAPDMYVEMRARLDLLEYRLDQPGKFFAKGAGAAVRGLSVVCVVVAAAPKQRDALLLLSLLYTSHTRCATFRFAAKPSHAHLSEALASRRRSQHDSSLSHLSTRPQCVPHWTLTRPPGAAAHVQVLARARRPRPCLPSAHPALESRRPRRVACVASLSRCRSSSTRATLACARTPSYSELHATAVHARVCSRSRRHAPPLPTRCSSPRATRALSSCRCASACHRCERPSTPAPRRPRRRPRQAATTPAAAAAAAGHRHRCDRRRPAAAIRRRH